MQYILVSFLIFYTYSSHLSEIVCGQTFNVLDYDADGDGETDDSQVTFPYTYFYIHMSVYASRM